MSDGLKFSIEIQHNRPITYANLNQAYLAFADEFQRFLLLRGQSKIPHDLKLYIREMRANVVTVDLVMPGVAPQDLRLVEETIQEFSSYLKAACEYLCGRSTKKPNLPASTLENLCRLLDPIAADYSAQLICYTTTSGATQTSIQIDNHLACNLRRASTRELRSISGVTARAPEERAFTEDRETTRPTSFETKVDRKTN